MDTSTVVAMARRTSELQTFCVSFSEAERDEAPFARAVSTHLGTCHHEVALRLDPVDLLSSAIRYMDEPFADSSALPTFAVSQAARQVAKVVLSGDGGDEVFGGYTGRYRVAALQAILPKPGLVARSVRTLPPWRSGRRSSFPEMLDLASLPDAERFVIERQITSTMERATLFGYESTVTYEEGLREIPREAIQHAAHWHPVHRALWVDMNTSLPNDMLTKVDRMSMAHGLEVRVPFLHHRLVEFALSLPPKWLVSPWPVEGKRLLRQVAEPLLPAGILDRPKQGFVVPLNRWLEQRLLPMFDAHCLGPDSVLTQWMDPRAISDLRKSPIREKPRQDLYALLVLDMWLERMRLLEMSVQGNPQLDGRRLTATC